MTLYWIIIVIIWLLVISTIAIFWSDLFVETDDYGTWDPPINTVCLGQCGEEGVQQTIQYCRPNPTTRYGCLNDDNRQTFLPRITENPCKVQCSSYQWLILEEEPCNVYNTATFDHQNPFNNIAKECSNDGDTIVQIVKRECVVGNNPNGPNRCTDLNGVPQPLGTIENVALPCNLLELENIVQCGIFDSCRSVLPLIFSRETITTTNEPFNLFYEGVLNRQNTCMYTNQFQEVVSLTPGPDDPPVNFCSTVIDGCRTQPTPQQVINKNISEPTNQNICATTQNRNPRCLTLGRKFPLTNAGMNMLHTPLRNLVQHPFTIRNQGGNFFGINPVINEIFFPVAPGNSCTILFWWVPNNNPSSGNTYQGKIMAQLGDTLAWMQSVSPQYRAYVAMDSYFNESLENPSQFSTVVDASNFTMTVNNINNNPSGPYSSVWQVSISGSVANNNWQNVILNVYPEEHNLESPWMIEFACNLAT